MSEDDQIDRAFAGWRAATEGVQPRAELLARIAAATQGASPSLAASVWRMGSRAAVALAVAAALLFVVAQRSVSQLEDRVAVNVEALLP